MKIMSTVPLLIYNGNDVMNLCFFFFCNLIYFTPWHTDVVPALLNHVWLKYTGLSLLQRETSCFQNFLVILVTGLRRLMGPKVFRIGICIQNKRTFINLKPIWIEPFRWYQWHCFSVTSRGIDLTNVLISHGQTHFEC